MSGDIVTCRVAAVEAASPEVRIIKIEPASGELQTKVKGEGVGTGHALP